MRIVCFFSGVFAAFSLRVFWVVCPVLRARVCGEKGHRNRANPAETCMNSACADSSACQRLNVSWHLLPPYVPPLRHAV